MSMPEDPLVSYRFVITLDPGDAYLPRPQADQVPRVAAGAFNEVTGLSGELEVTSYAEGGVNGYVHQLPVRHSWGRITLRRGVVRDHRRRAPQRAAGAVESLEIAHEGLARVLESGPGAA